MTSLVTTLRTRLARHAAYARTVRELRALPLDVALDLDICREDAPSIAARAVYGR